LIISNSLIDWFVFFCWLDQTSNLLSTSDYGKW
jgi:hypothetical protein